MQKIQSLSWKFLKDLQQTASTIWEKDKLVCLALICLYALFYFLPPLFVFVGAALLTYYLLSNMNDSKVIAGASVFFIIVFFLGIPALAYTYLTTNAATQANEASFAQTIDTLKEPNADLKAAISATQKVNHDVPLDNDGVVSNMEDAKQANLATIGQDSSKTLYSIDEVIDGNTLRLDRLGLVQLIGLAAPDASQCFAKESKEQLQLLTKDKQVYLSFDTDMGRLDASGRTLAYIYVEGGYFLNFELLKGGFDKLSSYSFSSPMSDKLKDAQGFAQVSKFGVWDTQKCSVNPSNKASDNKTVVADTPKIANSTPQKSPSPSKPNSNNPSEVTQPQTPSVTDPNSTPSNTGTSLTGDTNTPPVPDYDSYDRITYDTNHDGRITCADFSSPVSDQQLLNKYPALRRDKNGIACTQIR